MKQVAAKDASITDYERAVCYYTLPKVISPVTIGLLFAYALCVLEALAALGYGLYTENRTWTMAGFYSFIGIIIFGMVAFTVRALLNDWRRRVSLAVARNTPDASREDDVPDPFENHLLVARPLQPGGNLFVCFDREGDISHYVEMKRYNAHWRVSDAQNNVLFDVLSVRGLGQLDVFKDKQKLVSIQRRTTLRAVDAQIFVLEPEQRHYRVTNGCIYDSGRLVGRIYQLRQHLYLDVENAHANPGLLAYFVSPR